MTIQRFIHHIVIRLSALFLVINKKVILSGGAINSPQLLMLSGVGPKDELKKHHIPLVRHLPGVGRNLQDHLEVFIQYRCTQPITLYRYQVSVGCISFQKLHVFLSSGMPSHSLTISCISFCWIMYRKYLADLYLTL